MQRLFLSTKSKLISNKSVQNKWINFIKNTKMNAKIKFDFQLKHAILWK